MKCQVCKTGQLTGYNHYGSEYVCPSCKAFFMRSVRSNKFQVFEHEKNCVIDSKNRKSCKKCRFEKCLEIGMKIAFVTEPKVSKENKLIRTVFYHDEEKRLKQAFNSTTDKVHDFMYNFYAKNPQFAQCLDKTTRDKTFSCQQMDTVQKIDEQSTRILIYEFAKLDGISEDLEALFQHSFEKVKKIPYALYFHDKLAVQSMEDDMVNYGLIWKQNNDKDALVLKILEKKKHSLSLDYAEFFSSPWASNSQIEEEHSNLFKKIADWYKNSKDENEVYDRCLLSLIFMILIYHSDGNGPKFKDKDSIESAQQKYINLLHKYLKSKHSSEVAYKQLHEGLMLIHVTERLQELSMQRLQLDFADISIIDVESSLTY